MEDETKTSLWTRCVGVSPRDRRNQGRFVLSNLAWAIAYVGTTWVLKRELVSGPLAWCLAALPIILGLVVILSYSRFLRETDELQRLVQLEALALGFGGSFFAFCAYTAFERLGAPPLEVQNAAIVMVFLYIVGVVTGGIRYR